MREWTRAMDCHAAATAASRNDKNNAAKQKVDSRSLAEWILGRIKEAAMREWTRAMDCHAAATAASRNDKNNAAKQKVDSSGNAPALSLRGEAKAIHKKQVDYSVKAVDCHADLQSARNDKKVVDCHAAATAASRNDKNNAAKQKVDSSKGKGDGNA